eukprot:CAMPEP_0184863158 /NCGR_PEP_ID=MMETSP0580-20130426/9498_1 /TAXON_ID=1118495 /ORGANISM="Dactyliosolen fragilissimus" /LENGTH=172 /DNA_ID=CAMNT_0027361309 /DNA_START=53 /DNA_END=571 /DNA_ORIENTATION=-
MTNQFVNNKDFDTAHQISSFSSHPNASECKTLLNSKLSIYELPSTFTCSSSFPLSPYCDARKKSAESDIQALITSIFRGVQTIRLEKKTIDEDAKMKTSSLFRHNTLGPTDPNLEFNTIMPFEKSDPILTFLKDLQAMNRNARRPKKANHGKRPCSRVGRRARRRKFGNPRR